MYKCLFVTPHRETAGGKIIMERNFKFCKQYFGNDNVLEFILPEISKLQQFVGFVNGRFYPTSKVIKQIKVLIQIHQIKVVFIDFSLLGHVVEYLKFKFPTLVVITFFHNVEYDYFLSMTKIRKRWFHQFLLPTVKKSESLSVCFSDLSISMNNRDADGLKKLYGKKSDFLLPTSVNDEFYLQQNNNPNVETLQLLFVGSAFFANIEAVRWFIDEVMPHLKRKTAFTVVGKGFESIGWTNLSNNINIIGKVEDLRIYYANAHFIVSPIFSGSGMKTKTAEALMFGKSILGTDEAFEGFEVDFSKVGSKLNTAEEYISFLNNVTADEVNSVNEYSRNIYLQKYSDSILYETFSKKITNFLNLKGE